VEIKEKADSKTRSEGERAWEWHLLKFFRNPSQTALPAQIGQALRSSRKGVKSCTVPKTVYEPASGE
jgi:hypothetical protein